MDSVEKGFSFLVTEKPSAQTRTLQPRLSFQDDEFRSSFNIQDLFLNREPKARISTADPSHHWGWWRIKKPEHTSRRYAHVSIIFIASHSSEPSPIAVLKASVNTSNEENFQQAEGGTILQDENIDLNVHRQPQNLRVLGSKYIQPKETKPTDFAFTNLAV